MPYRLVMLLPSPILITDEPEQVEIGNWYYKGGSSIEMIMQDTPDYKLPKIIAGCIDGLPNIVNGLSINDSRKIKWPNPHTMLKNIQSLTACFDEDYVTYEKGFIEGFKAAMDFYKVCFTLSDINDAFNVGKNYNDTTVMDKSFQSILNVKIHNVEVDWQCTHCNGRNTHKMSCKLPTREERIVLVNNSVMVQKLL